MSDNQAVLARNEIRMTGIQIFLLVNADEYQFDVYDFAMNACATVGGVILIRMLLIWLVKYCSSDSDNFTDLKYAGIVSDENIM